MTIPEPGTYPAVSPDIYHSWDAANYSTLKELRRTPAHAKAKKDQVWNDTDAKRIGRATHTAVLEPAEYQSRYRIFDGDRRTRDGKKEWADALEDVGEANILRPREQDSINAMVQAVHNNQAARSVLEGCTDFELSLAWDVMGVRCKARLDAINPSLGAIVDLKTTKDASSWRFSKDIEKFSYHLQAWHYLSGADQNGLPVDTYIIIAVENKEPYELNVFKLSDDALNVAGTEMENLIRRYGECYEKNSWPGYEPLIKTIGLPEYK